VALSVSFDLVFDKEDDNSATTASTSSLLDNVKSGITNLEVKVEGASLEPNLAALDTLKVDEIVVTEPPRNITSEPPVILNFTVVYQCDSAVDLQVLDNTTLETLRGIRYGNISYGEKLFLNDLYYYLQDIVIHELLNDNFILFQYFFILAGTICHRKIT
jgi:hypothetical protein